MHLRVIFGEEAVLLAIDMRRHRVVLVNTDSTWATLATCALVASEEVGIERADVMVGWTTAASVSSRRHLSFDVVSGSQLTTR